LYTDNKLSIETTTYSLTLRTRASTTTAYSPKN
jgi:hypothetical protein